MGNKNFFEFFWVRYKLFFWFMGNTEVNISFLPTVFFGTLPEPRRGRAHVGLGGSRGLGYVGFNVGGTWFRARWGEGMWGGRGGGGGGVL